MSLNLYLTYLAACIVLVIVPGPTVTLIVASRRATLRQVNARLAEIRSQLGLAAAPEPEPEAAPLEQKTPEEGAAGAAASPSP